VKPTNQSRGSVEYNDQSRPTAPALPAPFAAASNLTHTATTRSSFGAASGQSGMSVRRTTIASNAVSRARAQPAVWAAESRFVLERERMILTDSRLVSLMSRGRVNRRKGTRGRGEFAARIFPLLGRCRSSHSRVCRSRIVNYLQIVAQFYFNRRPL